MYPENEIVQNSQPVNPYSRKIFDVDGNQSTAQALTHISLSIDSNTKSIIELAREAISLVLEPPRNRVHAKLKDSVQWPNDQLIEQECDEDRRVYCYVRWEIER